MTLRWTVALVLVALSFVAGEVRADPIRQGRWENVAYDGTRGGWRIIEADGARYVELTSDFETEKAPDLKIFLSPLRTKDLDSKNAMRGAVRVAKLTSIRGAARYKLPAVDLAKFQSIILHCEQYSVLFARSGL